jgi:hypothetical protein
MSDMYVCIICTHIHICICIFGLLCRAKRVPRGVLTVLSAIGSSRRSPARLRSTPGSGRDGCKNTPQSGAEREGAFGARPQRTHSLVIHGAHRTLPSAAGMVPRRPSCESTIEQPSLGDVHWIEQLHVRVPFAHMLLVPSHSNATPSGAAAPPGHRRPPTPSLRPRFTIH